MWFFAFLILPLLGLAYAAWHVFQLLPLAAAWRWAIVGAGVAAFLTLFLNFSRTIDRMPMPLATACYEVGNSSIFVLLYLVMLFLLLDLGRLLHVVPRTWLFANGWASVAVAAVMVGIFAYGNLHYRHKARQALSLSTHKPLRKDLKIVMLSDLHLGYHNRRAELARWVELINAERPDLILFGGDIIDISLRPLEEERMAEEFHRLNAPMYACLGNHEYYSDRQKALDFYRRAGITLLCDSVAEAQGIAIIGRDDRTNLRRKSLRQLVQGVEAHKFTILLDHQPYHLEEAEREGVDFQFSGHTHHGQVWPVSWVTERLYECAFGPWQRGGTRYYVSSGMGIWGGKFRIGTRSEYVVATLKAE